MSQTSRLLIDGDRFRTESPEATYEGVFNINVEAQPHEIDIEFIAGPEAGNWNFGIFQLDGNQLELCLDLNGKPRPTEFLTSPGSGHAYERLTRTSLSRPENVTGERPPERQPPPAMQDCVGFDLIDDPCANPDRREHRPDPYRLLQSVRGGEGDHSGRDHEMEWGRSLLQHVRPWTGAAK